MLSWIKGHDIHIAPGRFSMALRFEQTAGIKEHIQVLML